MRVYVVGLPPLQHPTQLSPFRLWRDVFALGARHPQKTTRHGELSNGRNDQAPAAALRGVPNPYGGIPGQGDRTQGQEREDHRAISGGQKGLHGTAGREPHGVAVPKELQPC